MRDNPHYHLDMLWEEAKAAIIVKWRVDTPEVRAEAKRAVNALLKAMLHDETVEDGEHDSS